MYVLFCICACEAYKTVVHNEVFLPISGGANMQLQVTWWSRGQTSKLRIRSAGLLYIGLPGEFSMQYAHFTNSVCMVHLHNLSNWDD